MYGGVLRGFVRGKFSPRQNKGWSISPKHMPVGWYKGRNVPSIGKHTAKGGFVIQPEKIPIIVVPDLTNCKLKPYVSPSSRPVAPSQLKQQYKIKTTLIKKTKVLSRGGGTRITTYAAGRIVKVGNIKEPHFKRQSRHPKRQAITTQVETSELSKLGRTEKENN